MKINQSIDNNQGIWEFLYQRRFTLFLVSIIITLFGDILFPNLDPDRIETILLLQNMLFSILLFLKESKFEIGLITLVILLGLVARFGLFGLHDDVHLFFAINYIVYFATISFRLFVDLHRQKALGLETISAVFCGFLLLGLVSSILFVSIDQSLEAFEGQASSRDFMDFFYFTFITLLTIGYGDIIPTIAISKKLVVFVGLLGHFYTVFVVAIIVGKYQMQPRDSDK